jgi:hypothetical protein
VGNDGEGAAAFDIALEFGGSGTGQGKT